MRIGRYSLVAEIGRGGMGVVYLGVAQGPGGFEKLLVIKELKPELVEDPAFLKMFLEEARLAARLNHPSIVQTYEVGEDAGRHYIAMEYLDGRPLHRVVRRVMRAGSASEEFLLGMQLRVLREVLRALQHVHTLSNRDGKPLALVHRDVSPQNVFVTFDGQVKLLDFGVAKAADSAIETRGGVFKGKVGYMPPEQLSNTRLDGRADVFAVGVMLWEAIAGQRLWANKGELEILKAIIDRKIPSPASVSPSVDPALEAICMHALAERDERFESAAAMEAALDAYCREHPQLDVSLREIGAAASGAFEDERRQVTATIDAHLAALAGGDDVESLRPLPAIAPILAQRTPSLPNDVEEGNTVTPVAGTQPMLRAPLPDSSASRPNQAPIVGAPSPPPTARRGTTLAVSAAVVAALGIVIGVVMYMRHRPHEAPRVASEAALATPASPDAAEPAAPKLGKNDVTAPASELVTVTVKVTPPGAQVTVNERPVPNPYVARIRKDEVVHVRAAAQGFAAKEADIGGAGSDQTLALRLDPADPPQYRPPRTGWRPPPAAPPPVAAPAATPVVAPTPSAAPPVNPGEVNPNGGTRPTRPVDTSSPYQP